MRIIKRQKTIRAASTQTLGLRVGDNVIVMKNRKPMLCIVESCTELMNVFGCYRCVFDIRKCRHYTGRTLIGMAPAEEEIE